MAVRYAVDERVLCWHQDLVYEAKVLEVRRDAETPEYYVHYKGWKNTYVGRVIFISIFIFFSLKKKNHRSFLERWMRFMYHSVCACFVRVTRVSTIPSSKHSTMS